jgi:hypothetical protein
MIAALILAAAVSTAQIDRHHADALVAGSVTAANTEYLTAAILEIEASELAAWNGDTAARETYWRAAEADMAKVRPESVEGRPIKPAKTYAMEFHLTFNPKERDLLVFQSLDDCERVASILNDKYTEHQAGIPDVHATCVETEVVQRLGPK